MYSQFSSLSVVYQIDEKESSKGCLYLSSLFSVNDMKCIKQKKIDAILSIISSITKVPYDKTQISKSLVIYLDDIPTANITQHFEQSNKFIAENLEKTNVLVHCGAGISRSPSLIIALSHAKAPTQI